MPLPRNSVQGRDEENGESSTEGHGSVELENENTPVLVYEVSPDRTAADVPPGQLH